MGYSAPFCGSCGFLTAIFLSSILLLVGIHANVLEIDDDAEHPVEETLLEDDDSWSHLVNKRSNSVNEDSFYDLGNLDNNNIAFVDDNDEIEDGNWFYRSIHRLKRSVSDLIAPESKRVRKSKKNKHNKEIAPLLKSSETSVHSKSNKKSKKSINVKPYSELKSKPSSLVKKKNKISSQYDDEEYTDDEDGFDQSGDHVISGSGDGGDMDENSIKTIHYYHVTMYTQDPWYNFYDLTTNHIIELRNRWHEKIERSFIDKPTEIEVLHIDLRNDNGVKAEVYLKAIDGRHSAKLIRNILKESAHGGPLQIFTIDPDRITVVTKEAKDVLSFEEHEEPQSPPLRSPGWNPLGDLAGGSSNSNDDDDDNMVEDYDDASNLDVDNTFETMIPLDNDFTTIEPKMCRGDDQVRCGNSSEHICDVQMCDGNIDCSNGADEENCTSSEVTTPMPTTTAYYCDGFTCDGTRCLNHDQKCDRNYDCSDGSDEENCPIVCRSDQFTCDNGGCVHGSVKCNGVQDCMDGSDEWHCQECEENQFKCSDGTCIDNDRKCDTIDDCLDGEDEEECDCEENEFSCSDGTCISLQQKCDGSEDCDDGSDEYDCTCDVDEFQCDNTCLDIRYRCDGTIHCLDESDETQCDDQCRDNEFDCHDGLCISLSLQCNGYPDCSNDLDEINCPICHENAFHCRNQKCIPDRQRCDGQADCDDSSDEEDCPHSTNTTTFPHCLPDQYKCDSGVCINDEFRCDGQPDCLDGSDEMNCGCDENQIECDDTCIDIDKQCDGNRDCRDGKDEFGCEASLTKNCTNDEFDCRDGQCIPLYQKCDSVRNCADNSDEYGCPCATGYFECHDDKHCIPEYLRCNRKAECQDGSDELDCPPPCNPSEFRCGSGECIPQSSRCDRRVDCSDRSDELNCTFIRPTPIRPTPRPRCPSNQWQCNSGECIPVSAYCNGRADCRDYSDEDNCPEITTTPRPTPPPRCFPDEWKCNSGECIPMSAYCDNRPDCRDYSDEDNCPEITTTPRPTPQPRCLSNQWQCISGECIPVSAYCNGRADCRDYSDENNCPITPRPPVRPRCPPNQFECQSGECIPDYLRCNKRPDCRDQSDETNCSNNSTTEAPRLNLRTYPNEQTIRESREVVFQCRDEGPIRAQVRWSRPNGQPLPPGSQDVKGRLEIPNIRYDHNGEYVCEAIGYSKYTPGAQMSVFLTVEKYTPGRPPTACNLTQATCMNGACIAKTQICDGINDCPDGSDEIGCKYTHACEPNEFKCRNSKCILKTWRCDGEDDCKDGSDEMNCVPLSPDAPCRYDEFKCNDNQCIPKSFHCDSHPDCIDRSDEIGCMAPQIIRPPPPSVTIPAGGVLNITCRATGVPTPIIVWRLNWGHVPEKCYSTSDNGLGTLTCGDMQPIDQGAYSCEIINSINTVFVSPDTIVIVDTKNPCSKGFFNDAAKKPEDCINCFCFGVSNQCKSADLFTYGLKPPVTSLTVVGVEGPWVGVRNLKVDEYENHQLMATRHGVQLRVSNIPASTQFPYYSLPQDYRGNQLKSYGGFIKYDVEFVGIGGSNYAPDIILSGNGYDLTYRHHSPIDADIRNSVEAQLVAENWQKLDNSRVSREELMMTLANVERILIKLQYVDGPERSVELLNIGMDSAGTSDRGLGSATLVEECRCPEGYRGLSCEDCEYGWHRESSGPWLGRCVREPEKCQPGYYGDPRNNIPCSLCPCPVVGNSHARTCSLKNRRVVCDCDVGYTGDTCAYCDQGYVGNPLTGQCTRKPTSDCDPYGTETITSDGRCICNPGSTGIKCDQCFPGTFGLVGSCVECFCMGVSQECSSATLRRDQIKPRTLKGFELKTRDTEETFEHDTSTNEVIYRNVKSDGEALYWFLPDDFLGNKLASYGGNLTYTIRDKSRSGGLPRNNLPDIVIHSNNKITLYHSRRDYNRGQVNYTYAVPLTEENWDNYADGTPTNREHFLMALENIKDILIKATYTPDSEEAALSEVIMDTSIERGPGSRAWEVEQCVCPGGHTGLSCEDCKPGYYKSDNGIYLGQCELCNCNGNSDDCDPKTGVCMNCRQGTAGDKCEQCAPGFIGNATGPAGCQLSGGEQYACERCDKRGTENCDRQQTCKCKANVQGVFCDECREGTFDLNMNHKTGCIECFCSGVTRKCTSSYQLYRTEKPFPFIQIGEKLALTDADNGVFASNNFTFSLENNEMIYYPNEYESRDELYWSLPVELLGDLILSYGGKLNVNLHSDGYPSYTQSYRDVILRGMGKTLYWKRPNYSDRQISIDLSEKHWSMSDRNGNHQPSRNDFMSVLSNVDSILIRATNNENVRYIAISDVELDTADYMETSLGPATDIESCFCPRGYSGTSCEKCDTLHYRDGSLCIQCDCNGRGESCALGPNRRVECRCAPGWVGPQCEYPDIPEPPTTMRPEEPTIAVVISSPTIQIVDLGETVSLSCSAYYIANNRPLQVNWQRIGGRLPSNAYVESGTLHLPNLQIADSGVYICEAISGPERVRNQVTLTVGGSLPKRPTVSINPQIVQNDEYESVDIQCTVSGYPTPSIEWRRLDAPMSSNVIISNGFLRFNSLRMSDSGTYECFASNTVGDNNQILQVYVRERNVPPPTMPSVSITPETYSGKSGDQIVLTCICTPSGTIIWSKAGEPTLPTNSISRGEMLIIEHANTDNTGRYICTVRFPSGLMRESQVDVVIHPSGPNNIPPYITALQPRYTVTQGTDFTLTCEASGHPYPRVKWTLNGKAFEVNVQQNGNILRILNAQPSNAGVYICIAENDEGEEQTSTVIDVERRELPVVEIYPAEPQTIMKGESTRLSCRATAGIPYPDIKWQRRDRIPFTSRISEDYPGVITLREVTIEDGGEYECHAANTVGVVTAIAVVNVLEPPIMVLYPDKELHQLTEGDELMIDCSATGKPMPNVIIRPPQELPRSYESFIRQEAANKATLHIYKVEQKHAGLYECQASSEAGTDVRYVNIIVGPKRGDIGKDYDFDNEITPTQPYYPPPRPPPYDRYTTYRPTYRPSQPLYPVEYRAVLDGRSVLSCNEERNEARTEWRRSDGRPLPSSARLRGGELVIENTQYDANGLYDCVATDNYGEQFTLAQALVTVISPPRITFSPSMPMYVRSGEPVRIFCNATGEQPIYVTWHGEEGYPIPRAIRVSGNYLEFNNINPEDAGRYYCSANNIHGNVTKVAEVIVNHNDLISDPYPTYGHTHEVMKGNTVRLTCKLPGNYNVPGIMFEWHRLDNEIPRNAQLDGKHLTLNNVKFDDAGRYVCNMRYPNGSSAEDYVDVIIKPAESLPILTLDPSRSYLRPGDSVEVDCSSSAGPQVQVTWQRQNGEPLPYHFRQDGNRLTITNVLSDDAGTYTCLCRTENGQEYMSDYELNVEVTPPSKQTRPPKVEYADVGSTVILKCNSDKYPSTFLWSRQHGTFNPDISITKDTLTLTDVAAADAGTYICHAKYNGQTVDIPTTLVVSGAIPFFPQSPNSYMSFSRMDQTYSKFSFEVTFKPEKLNGLILYTGPRRGNNNFISLSLHNGFPQFRFDFGGQQSVLQPEKPIKLRQWHTIKVKRIRNNGFMLVDDQPPVAFPSNLKFYGLNLDEAVFLGGVPKYDQIAQSAVENKEGFVGCISRLVINEKEIQLNHDAIQNEGTTSCEPCSDDPCLNEGVCLETQTDNGYTCVCQEGFTGKNCQIEGIQCSTEVCGIGRCQEIETGIECYCPLNRTGDRCQYIEHYDDGVLSFKDGSYAAYDKFQAKKSIKFRIKPDNTKDAIILYSAESEKDYGDYIAVVMKDGHVELRYNVGGKITPTIIKSNAVIEPNKWVEISAGRSRAGLGYLQVGDEQQNNEIKSGRAPTMFLKSNVYIGGYDKRIVLNRLGVTKGFDGCISDLEISGRNIHMIQNIRDSANVQNCGHNINQVVDQDENTAEQCRPGYGGNNCDNIVDICLAHEPCENGATCKTTSATTYSCLCPPGYIGLKCESVLNRKTLCQYSGDSYLELDRTALATQAIQEENGIAILFSTTTSNGLLFWYGQPKGVNFDDQDFMAIGINDGFLEFSSRLNGEESLIKYDSHRVNDGGRHVVSVDRQKNQMKISVDLLAKYGEIRPTEVITQNLPGSIFIGGAPNIRNLTGERYTTGFSGCIYSIEHPESGPIDIGAKTIASHNLDICQDSSEDPDLGTEPPVV